VKVHSFTYFDDTPSSRARVRQFIPALRARGIELIDHSRGPRDRLLNRFHTQISRHRPSSSWVQRLDYWYSYRRQRIELDPGDVLLLQKDYFPFHLLHRTNPKLMDLDDAVWLAAPAILRVLPRMDAVNVGNAFLAERVAPHNPRIHVTPTAIDTERFRNDAPPRPGFVVGWTGLSMNLGYLEPIAPALGRLMAEHADVRLRVIAERPPGLAALPRDRVEFVPWSPRTEVDGLRDIAVGIMPLADTERERGKCAFKMLQYMAMSRPVVVSPVGMNREVLARGACGLDAGSDEAWYQALEFLYLNRRIAAEMGRNGRRIVEQHYSVNAVVGNLAAALRAAAGCTPDERPEIGHAPGGVHAR
jgi:glycosyltransferase involved in cell wall biosynthesis